MRRTTATRKRAPDPHEGAGKRMSPRVPVQSDCTVHRDGSEFEGVLLDISTGGAAVEVLTRAPLDTGDEVTLELPTVLSVIKVAATVVSQDEEVFGTFVIHLKFGEIAAELHTLITQRADAFRERQAEIFLGRV